MAVVTTALSFLVGKLREELAEDIILLRGAREQMEWVETEFRRMECFLKDADGMEERNETMKNWRQEVRDLAYRAEDAIDIFFLKIDYARRAEGCWGQLKRLVFILEEVAACREVASEVEWMKQRLRSISESRSIYGIQFEGRGGAGEQRRLSSPQYHLLPGSGDAGGKFFGHKDKLPEWLSQLTTDAVAERTVFSIVGMAGVGKSTLADKLYKDDSVKKHFPLRAWVFVSPQCSMESISESLAPQLKLEKEVNRNVEKVKKNIRDVLANTRYLVVVDDVWDNKAWDDLACLLPDSEHGSRIILTTRNEDVARHAAAARSRARAQQQPVMLQRLKYQDSWALFKEKAMAGGSIPQELQVFAQEIVKKCDGVPFAIVSIAGVLADTKEVAAWQRASKSIGYLLTRGEERTSGILHLSYRLLPYELKPCFLYMASFPEEVRARKLIRMWAAEGLLEERGEESLEEVGEDCLRGLVQRSLVRVVEKSSTGGIKSCRIHNLLQHVALSEAKRDKFLQVYPLRHDQNSATITTFSTKARRLAIHGDRNSSGARADKKEEEERISISGSKTLRSVIIYPTKGKEVLGRQLQQSVFGDFRLLRVLDLQKAGIKELPSQIGHLIHLRYLALNFAAAQNSGGPDPPQAPPPFTLPQSIGKLRSLQTLECYYPYGIRMPSSCCLQEMQALRHLLLKSPGRFKYGGAGAICTEEEKGQAAAAAAAPSKAVILRLCNLQTLTNIRAGEWLKSISSGGYCRLRKLAITVDSGESCESVSNLVSLQSLSISAQKWNQKIPTLPSLTKLTALRKLSLIGQPEKLPDHHELPVSLMKLTLAYSRLNEEDMIKALANLNNLRILKLMKYSYEGNLMTWRSKGGFTALESLHLEKLKDLETLKFDEGAVPKLLRLNIYRCKKLKGRPEGLKHLKKQNSNFKIVKTDYKAAEVFQALRRILRGHNL